MSKTHLSVILAFVLGATLPDGSISAEPANGSTSAWVGPKLAEKELPFFLGCKATAPWNEPSRRLGVRAAAGATVLKVEPRSPAEQAGLRIGDLIVRFADHDVENVEDLVAAASLVPRGVPQTVEYVRGINRLETRLTVVDRAEAEPLVWFTHPSGGYRFRIPTAWSIVPPSGKVEFQTILWDDIESPERLYRVECTRQARAAPSATRALDDFVALHQKGNQDTKVVRTEIAAAPAAWVASYQGESPRVAVYQFAFCHAQKLYSLQFTAPALSSLEKLPLPLQHLLGTLQFAGVSAEAKPQPGREPTSQKDDKLPPGWQPVAAGDIQLHVPPKWEAVPGTRAGEGIWQLGSEETPEASVALVRNQPWEHFAPRVESPQHRQATVAGLKADVYEGPARIGPAGRVRVVILHPADPLGDELTAICFVQEKAWDRSQADIAQILASIRPGAVSSSIQDRN